jgi:response regulator RpfG family c-di-GMP phosphodiesterase
VIVDPNRMRYTYLSSVQPELRQQLSYCDSAAEALRLARCAPAEFYVVRMALPDMDGLDLVSLLQEWARDARFALIADSYDADEERRAFQLRRTKYLVEPMDAYWLPILLATPRKRGRTTVPHERTVDGSTAGLNSPDRPP